jgi:hypothetical protein
LEKRANAARSALPPQKAGDLDISFSGRGRQSNERSAGETDGIDRPVGPGDHVVGSDYVVIDPMNCASGFSIRHDRVSSQLLVVQGGLRLFKVQGSKFKVSEPSNPRNVQCHCGHISL